MTSCKIFLKPHPSSSNPQGSQTQREGAKCRHAKLRQWVTTQDISPIENNIAQGEAKLKPKLIVKQLIKSETNT